MSRTLNVVFALTAIGLFQTPLSAQEKTPAINQSNDTNTASSRNNSSNTIIGVTPQPKQFNRDLSKMVAFNVTANGSGETISFSGLKNGEQQIESSLSPRVATLLASEFSEDIEPTGIIIRVEKRTKYPSALYATIKRALTNNKISSQVYIAYKEPPVTTKSQEKISQEYVLKNAKATDVYDLISKNFRLRRIGLRLDPGRNSITANGTESQIKSFVETMDAFDETDGSRSTINGSKTPANRNSEKPLRKTNKNPPLQGKNTIPTTGANTSPNRLNQQGDGSANSTPSIEKTQSRPRVEDSQQSKKSIGRYQVTSVGATVILLDTATGKSWFLDGTEQESMFWAPIPLPNGIGN